MGIHEAPFPDLDDPYAQTPQVKSGDGDNEQKTRKPPECSKRKPYSSKVLASAGASLTTIKAII
jgi:hypothetical protein